MKKTIISLLLFLAPTFALALDSPMGGAWEVSAFANADVMADFLNALSMMVKSGSFKSLFIAIAIGGFVVSGGMGLMAGNPTKIFGYLFGFIILTYSIFGLKVQVHVKEMVYVSGSGLSNHRIVGEVPAAIAVPMSTINYISTSLTSLLETFMAQPASEKGNLPEGVLPFGAGMTITKDMTELKINDPDVRYNFNEFVSKCVIPRLVSRQMSMREMTSSTDIISYFENSVAGNSESTFVKFQSAYPDDFFTQNAGIFTCKQAMGLLKKDIENNIHGGLNKMGQKLFPQHTASALLSSDITTAIADSLLGQASGTATKMATQGAVLDLIKGVGAYQAEVLGADSTLLAMNLNNAARSQKTGWYTASVLFRDMASYMYSAIQLFLMGIAPLVVVMMLVPGLGGKLAGSYGKALVWLASWWPALHIVNFMMESYYTNAANNTYKFMEVIGGGDDFFGLNMLNSGTSIAFTDNMIIAIGFLATLVPTLMWGIINGTGMALTSMLDRASGAQHANTAAQQTAVGSFSAGQISTNNYSANKYDSMATRTVGQAPIESNYALGAQLQNTDMGGGSVSANKQQIRHEHNEQLSNAVKEARAHEIKSSDALQDTVQSQLNTSLANLSAWSDSGIKTDQNGVVFKSQDQRNQVLSDISQIMHTLEHGTEEQKSQAIASLVKAGMDVSTTGGISIAAGMSTSYEEKESRTTFSRSKDGSSLTLSSADGRTLATGVENADGRVTNYSEQGSKGQQWQKTDSLIETEANIAAYTDAMSRTAAAEAKYTQATNTVVGFAPDQAAYWEAKAQKEELASNTQPIIKKVEDEVDLIDETKNEGITGVNKNTTPPKEPIEATNRVGAAKATSDVDTLITEEDARKNAEIAEKLAGIHAANSHQVNSYIASNPREFNESPTFEGLGQLDQFSLGKKQFTSAGMIETDDGYNFTFASKNKSGETEYFALGKDGKLTQLNDIAQGSQGQAFYNGWQINQFETMDRPPSYNSNIEIGADLNDERLHSNYTQDTSRFITNQENYGSPLNHNDLGKNRQANLYQQSQYYAELKDFTDAGGNAKDFAYSGKHTGFN